MFDSKNKFIYAKLVQGKIVKLSENDIEKLGKQNFESDPTLLTKNHPSHKDKSSGTSARDSKDEDEELQESGDEDDDDDDDNE